MQIDKNHINKLLKQKPPFLFVDFAETSEHEPNKITAFFSLKKSNPILNGHFPSEPVLPGVLFAEMIAQTALILITHNAKILDNSNYKAFIARIKDVNLKNSVIPDCNITIKVEVNDSILENFYEASGEIYEAEELKCSGEITLYFKASES